MKPKAPKKKDTKPSAKSGEVKELKLTKKPILTITPFGTFWIFEEE